MASDYNPYGKAKKGESKSAASERKKKYYSFQREHAEETGDQATVDKIYGKLGKKSHSVDANKVDKMALATLPFGAAGIGRAMMGRAGGDVACATRGVWWRQDGYAGSASCGWWGEGHAGSREREAFGARGRFRPDEAEPARL